MIKVQFAPRGETLFHAAATAFGDATQWSRLALINGIKDPFLSGAVTLIIPFNRDS